ncbi:hypothetical protein QSJ19_17695 [Gordonia sp. ABSL11-1]|uniref:hypothetical protein n=1 Tax=Gordonia sp. ABSL11-1 TaxID=3053924 RepID=UPI002573B0EC|nr:hypothetical protein [Gordonia sp. ABSL11-1]MDL9947380.1 hypothetical protein [Gordonia sp. ABSL11-1]
MPSSNRQRSRPSEQQVPGPREIDCVHLSAIGKNAQKIEKSCITVYSAIDRLLGEALAALAGVADNETVTEAQRGAA